MAEPKAKTLQQRLGFFDEDLKSPVHDDILEWLQANMRDVVTQLYPSIGRWSISEVERLKEEAKEKSVEHITSVEKQVEEIDRQIDTTTNSIAYYERNKQEALAKEAEGSTVYTTSQEYDKSVVEHQAKLEVLQKERLERTMLLSQLKEWKQLGEPPARREFVIEEMKWEYTISSQSTQSATGYQSGKNVIGFVDMRVKLRIPRLEVVGLYSHGKGIQPMVWGQTTHTDPSVFYIFFEAKTRIPNLGELFRQINTYREYVKGPFVVVSPDDQKADLIQQQDIRFIKYPSPREMKEN